MIHRPEDHLMFRDHCEPIDFSDPKYTLYDANGEILPTVDFSKYNKLKDPSEVQWAQRKLFHAPIQKPKPESTALNFIVPYLIGMVIGVLIGRFLV